MERKARGLRRGLLTLICLFAASLGLFVLTACGGHQHTLTFVAGTEATCEEAGSPAHWTCADCGKNFADEAGTEELTSLVLPALGHDWDEGAETTPASCEDPGVRTYTCSRCQDTYTEDIAPLEHDWDDGVETTPASCETPGVRTYTCSRCQDTYTEDIAPLEHDWDTENIVWSWEGTASASAQISCKNGDHPQTLTAEVSSQQTQDPTDTAEGERTFTATVTFEGRTYTDQKTESIPRLSLAYALNDDQGSYTVTGMGTVTGTSVTVPDTYEGLPVTAVAAGAFRNAAITQITLSVNVTVIGADAFVGCENLEVTYGGTLADWVDIDFGNASANPLNGGSLIIGGEKVTAPVLSDSVTEIKPFAFAGATFVSITLNVSVVVIGTSAFEGADLGEVHYTGSVADWVDIDFENASANPLGGGSLVIGGEKVSAPVLPDSVTEIKPFAFAGATFVSITLNVSVTVIGAGAFEGADLGEVRYGGSIADWVGIDFENASANPLNGGSLVIGGEQVTDLVIPEGVTAIKPFAFAGATFVSVTIHVTVTVIGDSAFENCTVSASVSFTGTAEDWEKVDVGGENGLLEEVSCHTHSYQSEVTKDPTCTEEGVRTFTCSCGDTYTEPIATIDHNFVDGKCTMCGKSENAWDGSVASGFASGNGSAQNPYVIATGAQLAYFAQSVNGGRNFNGLYVVLTEDLDLGGREWTPIGVNAGSYDHFTGYFDGQGHTVSNFTITEGHSGYIGLFGKLWGFPISDLGVTDFTINVSFYGTIYAGGLVGYLDGGGTLSYCYAEGTITVVSTNSYGFVYAGGLAGSVNSGTLEGCHARVPVTASSPNSAYAGGLAGYLTNGTVVADCFASGDVSGASTTYGTTHYGYAGGLVGYTDDGTVNDGGTIRNSYATGNVSARANVSRGFSYAGGLVGLNVATLENSFALGDVSATGSYRNAGGLVGYNNGTISGGYRSADQTVTNSNNTLGIEADPETLSSTDFLTGTLEWSHSIWTFTESGLPNLDHHWNGGSVIRPATCLEEGEILYTCTVCGEAKTIVLPKTAHHYVNGVCTVCSTPLPLWDGSIAESFESGSGTELDPFVIATSAQLAYFAQCVNGGISFEGQYLILSTDLSLGGLEWTPIGLNADSNFMGRFDGQGFTVSNFRISKAYSGTVYVGLFGSVGANGSLGGLGVVEFTIDMTGDGDIYAGALAGYLADRATAEACYASGSLTVHADGIAYAGGLMGYADGTNSDIERCYAEVSVFAETGGAAYVGGLMGQNDRDVYNCYASGSVSVYSGGEAVIGGLAGQNNGGEFYYCYASGNISTDERQTHIVRAGGLLGRNYRTGGRLVRCFATGDLILFSSSIVSAGGLLGLNSATSSYLSYRSTEQSITVTKNGVISGSTNSDGSTEAEATLISEAFLTGTLGWSDQIWSFAGGQLPTLKL